MMQPSDDEELIAATKYLLEIGECTFDLTQDGPRPRPTGFGSRSCLLQESKYHYFVGGSCLWYVVNCPE